MKLYEDYLMERQGKQIIHAKCGFATFKINADHVYLEDVYIREEDRGLRLASGFVDEICELAKEERIEKIITTVDLQANNPGLGMRAILGYGFEPYLCENDLIYFVKNI